MKHIFYSFAFMFAAGMTVNRKSDIYLYNSANAIGRDVRMR